MERENEATLAIKEKENERKWEKKSIEMQKKIEALQNQHQVLVFSFLRTCLCPSQKFSYIFQYVPTYVNTVKRAKNIFICI